MKIAGKYLIVMLMLGLSVNSFAQAVFGIRAGLNLSNMVIKDNDNTSSEPKTKLGFNVGPTIEIPVTDMISFESALLISAKGAKYDSDGDKGSVNLLYLNVPLTAKAKFSFGEAHVFGALGPYLGYGVGGKIKQDGEDDYTIKWGSGDEDDFKPFDAGLYVGAGLGIKAIEITLSYDLGLASLSTYTDNGYKELNRCFAISLGYKFGKN